MVSNVATRRFEVSNKTSLRLGAPKSIGNYTDYKADFNSVHEGLNFICKLHLNVPQ